MIQVETEQGEQQRSDMQVLPCGCISGHPLAVGCEEAAILAEAMRKAFEVYEVERDALVLILGNHAEGEPLSMAEEEQRAQASAALWERREAFQAFNEHYWPDGQRGVHVS